MAKIKYLLIELSQYKYLDILLLVLIVLALHFSTITQPVEQVFDEKYYVPSANYILDGEGTNRVEHPPLGQLIIASGIRIFGDNPLGWRIFSVLFGVAGIIFFYLICHQLKMPPKYAFLATFLLAFENLTFIQSGVAMLDVFSLTLMSGAFWLYLKGRYTASGLFIALATLTKLTGILILPVILAHFILTRRNNFKGITFLTMAAPVTFLALMLLLDFMIWHKWLNPISQVNTMFNLNILSTVADYPSDIISRPWEWILKPEILTYWVDPHYLAMISPTIWVFIIPSIIFAIYKATKANAPALFAFLWFAGTYLIWIPISLITDRMSYVYYFYPAVGSICIAITLLIASLENIAKHPGLTTKYKKLISMVIPVFILLHLGIFIILSPVSYWWKLPLCVLVYLLARYYISKEESKSENMNVATMMVE
jgi:dolichyl-phosphate-mannose-protein mannosyltransferase